MSVPRAFPKKLIAFVIGFGTTFSAALVLGKRHHLAGWLTGLLYAYGWLDFYACFLLWRSFQAWRERRRLLRLWRWVEADALCGKPPARSTPYPDRPPQPDRRY